MYRTAFSVSESFPWGTIVFVLPGLLFLAGGVAMLRFSRGNAPPWLTRIAEQLPNQRPVPKWFPIVFIGFATLWVVAAGGGLGATLLAYRGALASGEHHVVEGVVTDFDPTAYFGKKEESFVVDGVRFAYSDNRVTPAFNHTSSHGGPIREGLRVRIAYLARRSDNAILKLEIADEGTPAIADALEKSPERPLLPMTVFIPIWMALAAFTGWLLLINRNVTLKRRLFAPLTVGGGLLFMAFVAQLGTAPWFVYLGIALVSIANLRTTGFCGVCGRTLRAPQLWSRPGACPQCTGDPSPHA